MQFGQFPGKVQADSGAVIVVIFHLVIAVENAFKGLGRYLGTVVCHNHFQPSAGIRRNHVKRQGYFSTLRSELHGIGQQVAQDFIKFIFTAGIENLNLHSDIFPDFRRFHINLN